MSWIEIPPVATLFHCLRCLSFFLSFFPSHISSFIMYNKHNKTFFIKEYFGLKAMFIQAEEGFVLKRSFT